MTEEKIKEKHLCNICDCDNHMWHEIYYDDHATLKKIDKTYIAWCEKINGYVLVNK